MVSIPLSRSVVGSHMTPPKPPYRPKSRKRPGQSRGKHPDLHRVDRRRLDTATWRYTCASTVRSAVDGVYLACPQLEQENEAEIVAYVMATSASLLACDCLIERLNRRLYPLKAADLARRVLTARETVSECLKAKSGGQA